METKPSGFWWMKNPEKISKDPEITIPKLDLNSSLSELLEKEAFSNVDTDVDVGSIIDEINRVAAQSPLGPYEKNIGERSIEDIMREAEKIYMESSRSFEQLSQRSNTSQNVSDLLSSHSKMSTPTPKSVSPLPIDPEHIDSDYSDDFSQESKVELTPSLNMSPTPDINLNKIEKDVDIADIVETATHTEKFVVSEIEDVQNANNSSSRDKQELGINHVQNLDVTHVQGMILKPSVTAVATDAKIKKLHQEIEFRSTVIKTLEGDNKILKDDIANMKVELDSTRSLLEKIRSEMTAKTLSSPEINLELEKALEELKDSKEINTALQLQLDSTNKTHQILKSSYDDLLNSNKNMERKMLELDSTLSKYKTELINLQQTKDKLLENEINLNKLLEIEKLQSKSLKLQNDKDAKCIQDLNRQIKEMERIIARKHPDSVSALIVAAKEDASDTNLTARRVLEDRIKTLEQEVVHKDTQSSKVFLDIQEKFNLMKDKYESHIEDLELHVSDLKTQLKRKTDTYDVYTQTSSIENPPQKENFTVSTQTEHSVVKSKSAPPVKRPTEPRDVKEDAHLLATIRGLQADLSNKEKVVIKLQKEIDEMRKTNRRLQKEREGSLRNLSERKEFRSYPERLALQSSCGSSQDFRKDEELEQVKAERDKVKRQLSRLEEDYQTLKKKRLDDLTALQDAHEREISNYMASLTPLREQLEIQQVSLNTLQSQLSKAKEELAIVTVERDHLNKVLMSTGGCLKEENLEVEALLKKIAFLEKRYEEREYRLSAIVHSLAQKNITNRSCEQCADRQKQLISYKLELDQLLASVRALH